MLVHNLYITISVRMPVCMSLNIFFMLKVGPKKKCIAVPNYLQVVQDRSFGVVLNYCSNEQFQLSKYEQKLPPLLEMGMCKVDSS